MHRIPETPRKEGNLLKWGRSILTPFRQGILQGHYVRSCITVAITNLILAGFRHQIWIVQPIKLWF